MFIKPRFSGVYMKNCLITGASGGIGRGLALAFAKKGYNLVLNYFSGEERIREISATLKGMGVNFIAVKADVSKPDEIENMKKAAEDKFGFIDTVIANAGISLIKQINDTTEAEFDIISGVNLKGVYFTDKIFCLPMIERKRGRIINISSMWGIVGSSCETAYSAAKGGVVTLTKALAKELAPSQITVNCICPGVIMTAMNENLGEDVLQSLKEQTPIGRLGNVEDIANAALFFASDEASFITGQALTVDGGLTL